MPFLRFPKANVLNKSFCADSSTSLFIVQTYCHLISNEHLHRLCFHGAGVFLTALSRDFRRLTFETTASVLDSSRSLSFVYVYWKLTSNESLDRLSTGIWICGSNPSPSRIFFFFFSLSFRITISLFSEVLLRENNSLVRDLYQFHCHSCLALLAFLLYLLYYISIAAKISFFSPSFVCVHWCVM